MVAVPDFGEFKGKNSAILKKAMGSDIISAEERAKLLNLAFDLASSGFEQRQVMYEYYHGGDPMRIRSKHYLDENLTAGNAMLKRIMKLKAEN